MILRGEALEQLAGLSAGSVQMCLSSPLDSGLRSYLPDEHPDKPKELGLEPHHDCLGWTTGKQCGACYVCQLVEVFSRVRECLTEDGTLWLNLGDSYTSGGRQDEAAERLGRQWIGIELNPQYLPLAGRRTAQRGLRLP